MEGVQEVRVQGGHDEVDRGRSPRHCVQQGRAQPFGQPCHAHHFIPDSQHRRGMEGLVLESTARVGHQAWACRRGRFRFPRRFHRPLSNLCEDGRGRDGRPAALQAVLSLFGVHSARIGEVQVLRR